MWDAERSALDAMQGRPAAGVVAASTAGGDDASFNLQPAAYSGSTRLLSPGVLVLCKPLSCLQRIRTNILCCFQPYCNVLCCLHVIHDKMHLLSASQGRDDQKSETLQLRIWTHIEM